MKASTDDSSVDLTVLQQYGIDSLWLDAAPKPRTILFAYPHPDDESFGNGGTIARYTAEGAAVHYVCATRGESGTLDPKMLEGYADVAALRTAEQTCAARALSLAAVHFLGHRDSGMPDTPDNKLPNALIQQPIERVAGQVVAIIRAVRPQVVVTFNPYGGYGHPDHVYLHYAVRAAFVAAGDPARFADQVSAGLAPWRPSKLYYPTFGARIARTVSGASRLFGREVKPMGQNADVDPLRALEQTTPVTTTVRCAEYLETNLRAKLCHRSQLGGMPIYERLPRPVLRRMFAAENFTRVIPTWNEGEALEHDLFEGM